MDREKWSCHSAVNFKSFLCCVFVTHDFREADNFLGDDNLSSDWRCEGIAESVVVDVSTAAELGLDGRDARLSTSTTADAASRVFTVI